MLCRLASADAKRCGSCPGVGVARSATGPLRPRLRRFGATRPDERLARNPLPRATRSALRRCALLAQISRERKLQIASTRIAAIQAMAQTTYAAGGGSAAKNGLA